MSQAIITETELYTQYFDQLARIIVSLKRVRVEYLDGSMETIGRQYLQPLVDQLFTYNPFTRNYRQDGRLFYAPRVSLRYRPEKLYPPSNRHARLVKALTELRQQKREFWSNGAKARTPENIAAQAFSREQRWARSHQRKYHANLIHMAHGHIPTLAEWQELHPSLSAAQAIETHRNMLEKLEARQ